MLIESGAPDIENFDRGADILEIASAATSGRVGISEHLGDIARNENPTVGRERAYPRGNVGNRSPGGEDLVLAGSPAQACCAHQCRACVNSDVYNNRVVPPPWSVVQCRCRVLDSECGHEGVRRVPPEAIAGKKGKQTVPENLRDLPALVPNHIKEAGKISFDDVIHLTGRQVFAKTRATLDIDEENRHISRSLAGGTGYGRVTCAHGLSGTGIWSISQFVPCPCVRLPF